MITKNTGFLLLEPDASSDSGELAKKLARCKGVKEVHLTSGKYGFVVSASASSEKGLEDIGSALKKAFGLKEVSLAMSHFVYR